MMHRTSDRSMVIALVGALVLAGCSSSTEPRSSESAQGYALEIVTSPASPKIGDTITATFTIENITSDTLTRTFAKDWIAPLTRVVSGADLFAPGNGFGDSVGESQATSVLVLAPHQVVTGVSSLIAARAGQAELSGCLAADVVTGAEAICTDAVVVVRAR